MFHMFQVCFEEFAFGIAFALPWLAVSRRPLVRIVVWRAPLYVLATLHAVRD